MQEHRMSDEKNKIKNMANLLKSGATMLSESCPICNSPLFKIQNEIWCKNCDKRVLIIKEEESVQNLIDLTPLENFEKIILTKLQESCQQIKEEKNPNMLKELGNLISIWLDVLERLKRLQKQSL